MQSTISFEEFSRLALQSKTVFVHKKFISEKWPITTAYQSLKDDGSSLIETHAAEGKPQISFLGVHPFVRIFAKDGKMVVEQGESQQFFEGDPIVVLKALFKRFNPQHGRDIEVPFFGSFVGFFSYDAVRSFEKIPDRHQPLQALPDIFFQLYRTMIIVDHAKGTTIFLELAESDSQTSYRKALERIECHLEKLRSATSRVKAPKSFASAPMTDLDDESYMRLVERAKLYLQQGDIFQVVLSRSFKKPCEADPLSIYQTLQSVNPSPYMFLLNVNGYSIVGSSPEKLISVRDGQVATMPIAGTCPRCHDDLDTRREESLLEDPKENAEHMMLVDLARNDLGVVSHPGSVKVSRLKYLQRLSHVTHLVSEVHGTLQEGLAALDALKAAFPAGTLSGAPKIRAMEIIDELEKSRRGLYGGAICSFDSRGNMDSFLAIRMASLKEGIATVRAGAGIVLDSNPQKEADETRHKANAVLEAIRLAEEASNACHHR